MASQKDFQGVSVTTVTPFDSDGSISYGMLADQTAYLIEQGIRILVVCGNTGEFTSLSLDEIERVTAETIAAARGKATIIAGIGWSSPMAVRLATSAQAAGADAVMVHHPAHTFISRTALRRYYDAIIGAVRIGVIPYKRGPELSDDLLRDLVQDQQVVAVKYGNNDVNAFGALVEAAATDVTWICGTAERWAPYFWLAGARGFTSGLAAFAPRKSLELEAALKAGNYSAAMAIVSELRPFEELRQRHFSANNVPAVKEAMFQLGLGTATVRDPLQELDGDERSLVTSILTQWKMTPAAAASRTSPADQAGKRDIPALSRAG